MFKFISAIVLSFLFISAATAVEYRPPSDICTTNINANDSNPAVVDRAVTFEIMIGLSKKPTIGGALRYRRGDGEGHIAMWGGEQSNVVVGFGVVADSESKGVVGNDMRYLSGTMGVAYAFNNRAEMNGFVPFGRVAGGWQVGPRYTSYPNDIEVSFSQYGVPGLMKNESFVGLGVRNNRLKDNRYNSSTVCTQGGCEEPYPEDN